MTYFTRSRILFWLVISAVLVDFAAVATIFYRVYFVYEKEVKPPHDKPCSKAFLPEALKFSPEQAAMFARMKDKHSDSVAALYELMRLRRESISAGMVGSNPDTLALFASADTLGMLYAQSRKLYLNHFFEISSICDATQKQKLSGIFSEVFCCDKRMREHKPCGSGRHHPHNACMKDKNNQY